MKKYFEINKCKNNLVFYNNDGFNEYQNYSYEFLHLKKNLEKN